MSKERWRLFRRDGREISRTTNWELGLCILFWTISGCITSCAYWGNPYFCISGIVSGAPGAMGLGIATSCWGIGRECSKAADCSNIHLFGNWALWYMNYFWLWTPLSESGSALCYCLAPGMGFSPSLAVSCHPQPGDSHLRAVLVSPEYAEYRGFQIVMVLWCCHFWDNHPEERRSLVSSAWPETFSNGKQLEVSIKDTLF